MKLITLDQARVHLNADVGDETDDAYLTTCCNAAEAACARLANRSLFATTADMQSAVGGVPAAMTAAYAAYDAAVVVAESQTDERMKTFHMASAQTALNNATNSADAIVNGLALDAAVDATGTPVGDDIIMAVLLAVGNYYRNRESVVSGQGAAAVEVPQTTQDIMRNNRWIGPL